MKGEKGKAAASRVNHKRGNLVNHKQSISEPDEAVKWRPFPEMSWGRLLEPRLPASPNRYSAKGTIVAWEEMAEASRSTGARRIFMGLECYFVGLEML